MYKNILVPTDGTKLSEKAIRTAATLAAPLPQAGLGTLYTRAGDWPGWLAAFAVIAMAGWRRRRADEPRGPAAAR